MSDPAKPKLSLVTGGVPSDGIPVPGTRTLIAFGFTPGEVSSMRGFECEKHHVSGFDTSGGGCWMCRSERERGE